VTDLSFYSSGAGFSNFPKKSAYGTYVALIGYTNYYRDGDKVYIFKDGALLQTLTDSDLAITSDKIRNVAVSPTGKYIVVSGYITAESAMGWVVLQGS